MATSTSALIFLVAAVLVALPVSSRHLHHVKHHVHEQWSSFHNLSGCHVGQERKGLSKLKDYLCQFGYLPKLTSSRFTDVFDADLEEAVRTYQCNFGLEVTGQLDQCTLAKMMVPRCGDADIINGTSTMGHSSSVVVRGRNLYSHFLPAGPWPPSKRSFKYAINETSQTSIDRATLSKVLARAFARWSAATVLNFTETASASNADITIGFYSGNHGDGEPFDGPKGVLAHGFAPTLGILHFDAAEDWVAGSDVTKASSARAMDLESVAVHEIGHVLGLGHTSVQRAVMFPSIPSRTRNVDLHSDDVNGIQSLYGAKPSFKP